MATYVTDCIDCQGTGEQGEDGNPDTDGSLPCIVCEGTGQVERDDDEDVSVDTEARRVLDGFTTEARSSEMNKARRNEISKVQALIEEAQAILQAVADEEREAFDNLSEGLQATDQGQRTEASADALEEALTNLDEAFEALNAASE